MQQRIGRVERNTSETKIKMELNLDGSGKTQIDTGIGFFDHMLNGFARHGLFDLDVKAEGDLIVDCHHTVEDTGIVLGNAIRKAVGNKSTAHRTNDSSMGSIRLPYRLIPCLFPTALRIAFPSTCLLYKSG